MSCNNINELDARVCMLLNEKKKKDCDTNRTVTIRIFKFFGDFYHYEDFRRHFKQVFKSRRHSTSKNKTTSRKDCA